MKMAKKASKAPMAEMATPAMTPAEPKKPGKAEPDYEAEDAFRTMLRAHEIQSNPDLLARAHKHGRKLLGTHRQAVSSLEDLKARASERRKELSDTDSDGM